MKNNEFSSKLLESVISGILITVFFSQGRWLEGVIALGAALFFIKYIHTLTKFLIASFLVFVALMVISSANIFYVSPSDVYVSPSDAVKSYYQLINDRQYEKAWTLLSPNFKHKMDCSSYNSSFDCANYISWWNSVSRVDIRQVDTLKQTDSKAKVYAKILYSMNDGRQIVDNSPYIDLILEASTRNWLFDAKRASP